MNNLIFTFKIYVFNQKNNLIFVLLCCLMPMLQSCFLNFLMLDDDKYRATIKASADVARLGYAGPSYDGFDTFDDNLLGENLGIMFTRGASGSITAMKPDASEVLIPNKFDAHNLAIMSGIEIIRKGGKTTFTSPTEIDVARLTYLQIPIYAIYQYKLPTKGTLYGGLGPYFAYGLGGNVNITRAGKSTDYVAFDKNGANYHRFDAGLGILGGYKLENGLSFELEYQLGLTNIDGKQFFDDKVVNRVLSLNVGYPISKILGAVKPKKKK